MKSIYKLIGNLTFYLDSPDYFFREFSFYGYRQNEDVPENVLLMKNIPYVLYTYPTGEVSLVFRVCFAMEKDEKEVESSVIGLINEKAREFRLEYPQADKIVLDTELNPVLFYSKGYWVSIGDDKTFYKPTVSGIFNFVKDTEKEARMLYYRNSYRFLSPETDLGKKQLGVIFLPQFLSVYFSRSEDNIEATDESLYLSYVFLSNILHIPYNTFDVFKSCINEEPKMDRRFSSEVLDTSGYDVQSLLRRFKNIVEAQEKHNKPPEKESKNIVVERSDIPFAFENKFQPNFPLEYTSLEEFLISLTRPKGIQFVFDIDSDICTYSFVNNYPVINQTKDIIKKEDIRFMGVCGKTLYVALKTTAKLSSYEATIKIEDMVYNMFNAEVIIVA